MDDNLLINYFVSYSYSSYKDGILTSGFGNIQLNLRYPVINFEDIKLMTEEIKRQVNSKDVVILFFRDFAH